MHLAPFVSRSRLAGQCTPAGRTMHVRTVSPAGRCALLALVALCVGPASAGQAAQTDWSAGPGEPGPVTAWSRCFDGSTAVSWLAIPGQVTLASVARTTCPEHLLDGDFDGACSAYACDIDNDGDNDILAAARRADCINLWRNDGGDPIAWTRQTIVSGFDTAICVHACDLDQDGDTDILGAAYEAAEIAWWRNDGGDPIAWTRQAITTDFYGAHQVFVADVDGDGRRDVLGVSQHAGEVAWWRNEGGDPIQWSRRSIATAFPMASSVHAADVDGDGRVDVLAASCVQPGAIALWRNGGGDPIAWIQQTIDPAFALAHWVRSCDLDRDGDVDVLGAAYTASDVTWWRNDGGTPIVWTKINIDTFFYRVLSAEAFDLDGDGDLDVLGAAEGANQVVWWENRDGVGTSWQEHMIDSYFRGAWTVHAADIDGDGDLDPVCAGDPGNDVSWWEATDFVAAGELISTVLDLEGPAAEATLNWSGVVPPETTFGVQVRTGSDPVTLGEWSAPLTVPGLLGPISRYVQYRVRLESGTTTRAPILRDLALDWTPGGSGCLEGDPASPEARGESLRLRLPSPALSQARVELDLPRAATVRLQIFSPCGRLIRERVLALPAGRHQAALGALPTGLHLCRVTAGDLQAEARVTVLR